MGAHKATPLCETGTSEPGEWLARELATLNNEAEAFVTRAEELIQSSPALARQFIALARASNDIAKALNAARESRTTEGLGERIAAPWMLRQAWIDGMRTQEQRERRAETARRAARAGRGGSEVESRVKAKYAELIAKGRRDEHNFAGVIAADVERTAQRVRQILAKLGLRKRKAKSSSR